MQPEAGEESDDDIAECGGGKNEGEVGPGERRKIAGEEANEQRNAECDPRSENGGDERGGMRDGEWGECRHAAREACIPQRCT